MQINLFENNQDYIAEFFYFIYIRKKDIHTKA